MTVVLHQAPIVVPLAGTGCSVPEVGGKAAGLDRLAAHGFPIPDSFVITASAYRRFTAAAGLAGWLERFSDAPPPDPGRLQEEAAEVERRFLDIPLEPEVSNAIGVAARPLLARGPVAVRSSATAEDLGIASFAGQYRTYVNVETEEAVRTAVRRCWASLWLPAARAYRRRHGIADISLAMAVVVQAMVAADWSGVGFSRDPAGRRDLMRIEVVPGLGEALVSGRITPADFTIRRDTLEIRAKGDADAPVFLEDLGRLILQVEDRLDEPQDVEWAFVDGSLTLLQARPITVGGPTAALDDGFDEPTAGADTFTPHGVVEMLPGVVPPLLWTITAPMLEDAFRSVVASLGDVVIAPDRRFVGRFRGRAALDLSALRDVAQTLPGGSAIEVERQFLGRTLSSPEEEPQASPVSLRALVRARRAQRRIADEVELAEAAVGGIVRLRTPLGGTPAAALLGYRAALRDLAWRLTAAEVAASSAGAAAYRGLEVLLQRWVDEGAAAGWAQRLTAGSLTQDAVGVARTRAVAALFAELAAPHRGLCAALAGAPVRRSRDRLLQLGDEGRRLVEAVDDLLRTQGCRAVYAGASWAEDPEWVWQQLALHAGGAMPEPPVPPDARRALDELMETLGSRRWGLFRVLTGQIVDLRRRWIARQAAEATRFLGLRERAKAALLTLGGEERRIVLEGATRLVASRQLRDPGQVELLSDAEFAGMVLGAPPPPEGELHRRATVQRRCREAGGLPDVFVGTPDVEPHVDVGSSATLRGWAASPGIAAGPARIVGGIDEGARLERGDVLVAHATDPSWTPLLMICGALVLEEGGPLSHGAIVAREFGLPAVLTVRGATHTFLDGELLEVDGFSGAVRRLRGEEDA